MEVALKLRHKFQPEMAKLLLFDRDPGNVIGFVMVYKLYIRIRIRGDSKEIDTIDFNRCIKRISRCLERKYTRESEIRDWKFTLTGEFLAVLKREFREKDNKLAKVVKLK